MKDNKYMENIDELMKFVFEGRLLGVDAQAERRRLQELKSYGILEENNDISKCYKQIINLLNGNKEYILDVLRKKNINLMDNKFKDIEILILCTVFVLFFFIWFFPIYSIVISGTAILIIAAGSIYGKSESGHKEGEPDVVGTFSVNRDENITVVANRGHIGDKEAFARELLQMYKDDSFYSTKFSTDRGYATSLDMNIYLWKEDIEDGESVMTAEYRPVEYGKDYDVVNNPDKFQLYIDGKEAEE